MIKINNYQHNHYQKMKSIMKIHHYQHKHFQKIRTLITISLKQMTKIKILTHKHKNRNIIIKMYLINKSQLA